MPLDPATWSYNWQSVACSRGCVKIAALAAAVGVFISEDGGASWRRSLSFSQFCNSGRCLVAASADFRRLVAAVSGFGGALYTSSDGGATWEGQPSTTWVDWSALAVQGNSVATLGSLSQWSSDGGTSWRPLASLRDLDWNLGVTCLAFASNGTTLLGGAARSWAEGGGLFNATNGAAWVQAGPAVLSTYKWTHLAASPDGSLLALASSEAGAIFTSADAGVSWVQRFRCGAPACASLCPPLLIEVCMHSS